MPQVREFFLKWRRKDELLKPPSPGAYYHREKPKDEDFSHVYRLIAVSAMYYLPYEYQDPITQKPVEYGVADIIEREAESIRTWKRRRKLEVRRQIWAQANPTDRWNPVNKYHTLNNNGGRIIQELAYDFANNDRSRWYPLWWSFLLAHPMLLYVPAPENPNCFVRSRGVAFDFWYREQARTQERINHIEHIQDPKVRQAFARELARLKSILASTASFIEQRMQQEEWAYPGLDSGNAPPAQLLANMQVGFGKLDFNKKVR